MKREWTHHEKKPVHHEPNEPTPLERGLWLHGQYRRRLEPLGVTPLRAGVLLFLHRHTNPKMTDTAQVLCVRLPTLSEVVQNLFRKRWVTKRRSVCHLKLSRWGLILTRKIETQIPRVSG